MYSKTHLLSSYETSTQQHIKRDQSCSTKNKKTKAFAYSVEIYTDASEASEETPFLRLGRASDRVNVLHGGQVNETKRWPRRVYLQQRFSVLSPIDHVSAHCLVMLSFPSA